MKRFLLFFLAVTAVVFGLQTCDFKPQEDMLDPCPDSLKITFVITNDTVDFFSELTFAGNHADLNYLWSFGDNESSTDKNPRHIYSSPGPKNVTLTVSTSFCTPAAHSETIIIGEPRPTADFTPKNPKVIIGETIQFQSQTTGNVTSYQWLVNGAVMGTTANFLWIPTAADTVAVCFIACGPSGCSDTVCTTVIVRPITFPWTMDLDGSANTTEKIVGLTELSGGGYGLVVTNLIDPGCFIIKTDMFGSVVSNPGLNLLSTNQILEPANFIKIGINFILVGQTRNASGAYDIFALKLNSSFNNAGFQKLSGDGSTGNEFAYGVAIAPDNTNLLMIGSINTTSNKGMYLPTVANNAGLTVSDRDYLFPGDQNAEGRYLLNNPTNTGYWAAGQITNASSTKEAVFLTFSYSGGNVVNPSSLPLGINWDVKKILRLDNGKCLVIGNGSGFAKAALVDVAAQTFTEQSFSSTKFNDAIVTNDGRVVLTGYTGSLSSAQVAFFQLDPLTLNLAPPTFITKTLGSSSEVALSMIQTADGGFAFGGYSIASNVSKSLLIKTDKNGKID